VRLYSIGEAKAMPSTVVARISTRALPDDEARRDVALLWKEDRPPHDTGGYAAVITPRQATGWSVDSPLLSSVPGIDYLQDGDVIRADPNGYVRTVYRRNSPNNFILTTDRCNSYCLMCSQPPRQIDDSARIKEHLRLISLIDPETNELVITGGEPTLLKDDFIRLIERCKERLPHTAIHVLTNGRMFYYRRFAERLAAVGHPDLMLGIPVYSDVDSEHDYVVQAKGAFEETILGLHNLARYNVPVEIRVVLHAATCRRLPKTAEFIARNLPFAAQVVLMGMEMVGFVHKNLSELWIDPHDYQAELREATWTLARLGMRVWIYNHQLCVLDRELWPFSKKSISDWKNIYLEECNGCGVRNECGGFFESAAKKHSAHISAVVQPQREQGEAESAEPAGASPLVSSSAAKMIAAAGGAPFLDVGCGRGADAILLAEHGAAVLCLDKDISKVQAQQQLLAESSRRDVAERLTLKQLDVLREPWPFGPRTVGGIINIRCFLPSLMRFFEHSLLPGGYLCVETAQGHGRNYLDLPKAGQMRAMLEAGFDLEAYEERAVGPAQSDAVAVRLLARKKISYRAVLDGELR